MSAIVLKRTDEGITVQVKIKFKRDMLETEESIQQALNEAGTCATGEALSRFDADGDPIEVCGVRMTSKCRHSEDYQTPYGPVSVERHLYQTSKGGRSFCPLESGARMILNSTPRYAKMISFKYGCFGANLVARDFKESHGRKISRGYIKNVADVVGSIAEAKEERWGYALPEFDEEPATISIGLDGTCMLLKVGGWREAMTGTISFYDRKGERFHTIYLGAAPEYGKSVFLARFEREIIRVKARYPTAHYLGLADGATDNWKFLERHANSLTLDFFHASEYVGIVARAVYPRKQEKKDREEWLTDRLHKLKHKHGAAKRLLSEMIKLRQNVRTKERIEKTDKAITYFRNQYTKMGYAANIAAKLPIGSGVTEAACKTLIKQRLCASGMRWNKEGASLVLSIRALVLTIGRWEDFWKRVSQYGVPTVK